MIVYKSGDKIPDGKKCCIALGNFDGVHKGHTKLFRAAREYAARCGLEFGVYTFEKHPRMYKTKSSIKLLTTNEEKTFLIEKCGADFLYFEDFGKVMDFEPEEFADYICNKFGAVCTFCGENFRFGKAAGGNSTKISMLMKSKGLDSVIIPTLLADDEPVSSTRIRTLLENGDAQKASELLGYAYSFNAEIIHGASLGHTIGFPTINQKIPENKVMPKFGVYAASVTIDGMTENGVTNIGVKPTVESKDGSAVSETYIIDFSQNVYGRFAKVSLHKMLRSEKKFSGLEELTKNISLNVEQTRKYFKGVK